MPVHIFRSRSDASGAEKSPRVQMAVHVTVSSNNRAELVEKMSNLSKYAAGAAVIVPILLYRYIKSYFSQPGQQPFSHFLQDVKSGRVKKVMLTAEYAYAWLQSANGSKPASYRTALVNLFNHDSMFKLLQENGVEFSSRLSRFKDMTTLLVMLSPILYLGILWYYMHRISNPDQDEQVGRRKKASGSKRFLANGQEISRTVTFRDVAGIDAAKTELEQIVDILRNRERYERLGARLPRGILLSGPSGTGKTLLAKCLANEAQINFISCSASDFVEMLVGRGAARVRKLFQKSHAQQPCIIFIDEIDALAKTRGGFSGNDEREQTLNQLLTEMDGFDSSTDDEVIVIAATNRPEILDPALIRPGRFDRHVHVGLPDESGRKAILQVHLRRVCFDKDVDIDRIAQNTTGYSGAELATLVNEAAIAAAQRASDMVQMVDLTYAVQKLNRIKELSQASTLLSQAQHLLESQQLRELDHEY